MRARIFTAAVLAILLVAVLLYGTPLAASALFAVFIALGAWEWSAFLGSDSHAVRVVYSSLLLALALLALQPLGEPRAFAWLMKFAVAWWTVALFWLLLAPQFTPAWAAALAGACALVPGCVALMHMVRAWPQGAHWVLFILALAFAADTGAYFVGHAFGRVKLAPRVSPRKTWEGVLGGMALAAVAGFAGSQWFDVPARGLVPLCLLGAAYSVVGDLTESMFKRAVGLKDSGRLFPGHGGVLDRVDGVLAATPVLCMGLGWLGVGS
jgi:phosphatidate cytidylyltransferase